MEKNGEKWNLRKDDGYFGNFRTSPLKLTMRY